MAKRSKNALPFDKVGGVVVVQRRMLESAAYLSLPPQAKVLITLLQVHWRPDTAVGFGVREAEQKIPCDRRVAMRVFNVLERAGFIEQVEHSLFNSRVGSKTRTWRLTWLPWQDRPPTNDWEKTK